MLHDPIPNISIMFSMIRACLTFDIHREILIQIFYKCIFSLRHNHKLFLTQSIISDL